MQRRVGDPQRHPVYTFSFLGEIPCFSGRCALESVGWKAVEKVENDDNHGEFNGAVEGDARSESEVED